MKSVPLLKLRLLVPLLLLLAVLPRSGASITGMTVFGDSLSDEGNSAFLIPDPAAYDNGRWSNGPVWVEYLGAGLGLAPITSNSGTAATGSNFAYGGSTSGPQADISGGLLPNLQTQVGLYLSNTAGAGPNAAIANNLFVLWSGGNDVINRVEGGPVVDPSTMAGNISSAITSLYDAGARQFLIPNLPPLGEKPDFRLNPAEESEANSLVDDFNGALSFDLDQLESAHSDIQILRLDIHGLVNGILADPAAYGLSNVTEGAYTTSATDPSRYLFWDATHPTTVGHQLIANEALALVPEPRSVLLLSLGIFIPLASPQVRRRFGFGP